MHGKHTVCPQFKLVPSSGGYNNLIKVLQKIAQFLEILFTIHETAPRANVSDDKQGKICARVDNEVH